ncbi:MAG: 2-phospho-L-lactate/phosphoenolpyruvate guanylyltransferase [Actinomycetota bacterium]|nr:2-phospho-L-lactate/phosphoenolpyruvate guanylyltransferase [Actinomycetota bacterium]
MLMPIPEGPQPTHRTVRPRGGWTLLIPLKGGPHAKSRLGASPELARAIALDTLRAALDCTAVRGVRVVTSDVGLARSCVALGAQVCPESVRGAGPSRAVLDGVRGMRDGRAGGGKRPVAVLLGDLPALRPEDLQGALAATADVLSAPGGRGATRVIVPDLEGTGTVLLAASSPRHLSPAFGPDSAAAHVRAGAVPLLLDLPRLRRDVDTREDLLQAIGWGVGPLTAERLRTESSRHSPGTGPGSRDGARPTP